MFEICVEDMKNEEVQVFYNVCYRLPIGQTVQVEYLCYYLRTIIFFLLKM
ncbi:hypothetical protein YC2023_008886 [Brassica napus]